MAQDVFFFALITCHSYMRDLFTHMHIEEYSSQKSLAFLLNPCYIKLVEQ